MSIIDNIISLIAPHTCLTCGVEGRLLCTACSKKLKPAEPLCYRCQKPSQSGFTCLNCSSPLTRVRVATDYADSAKALIWQLKLNGAQTAARLIAHQMAALLNENDNEVWLVPVPTATSRTRQRGYDQAKLLTHELARQTGLPYLDCLARHGQTHQHGSSRQARLQQLEHSFWIKRPKSVQEKHILLIDDVMTTGATLESAARILKQTGAVQVEALVFARPNLR